MTLCSLQRERVVEERIVKQNLHFFSVSWVRINTLIQEVETDQAVCCFIHQKGNKRESVMVEMCKAHKSKPKKTQ